ncbi:MAG: acyl-CoA/acyl-ACP dehydrogenase [Chloroflexi bacterium]|nr:acyl-CoA/acyl-ACP dehydrogenase [Chloroflexota bacterium]
MVDLSYSQEQQLLRKAAREFFERECPYSLLYALEEDSQGFSQDLWQKMAELGWLGLSFPKAYGGEESSLIDLGVLLEEFGRAACAGPYFSTVALGGALVQRAGSEEQKKGLLPKLVRGGQRLALAVSGPTGRTAGWDIPFRLEQHGKDWRLTGTSCLVDWGHVADVLVCAARPTSDTDAVTLLAIDAGQPGLRITQERPIDNERVATVEMSGVPTSPDDVVGEVGMGWPSLEATLEQASALRCAEMVGGTGKVLEMTVRYAQNRVVLGRPIGGFQAVQGQITDAYVLERGAWLATYRALWALSSGRPAAKEVSVARVLARDAYLKATSVGAQIHAAIGHMKEYPLQFYFRRAKGSELRLGGMYDNLEKVALGLGL